MKIIAYTIVIIILIASFAILGYLLYRQRAILFPSLSSSGNFETIPEGSVKVISPKGGETYCIGDEMKIEWEAKDVKAVQITIANAINGSTPSYEIDSVPANYGQADNNGVNFYKWKVGEIKKPAPSNQAVSLQEGNTYVIRIVGSFQDEYKNAFQSNKIYVPARADSNGVFSIKYCEPQKQKDVLNVAIWKKYEKDNDFSVNYPSEWTANYNSSDKYVEFKDPDKQYFAEWNSNSIAPINIYLYDSQALSADYYMNKLKNTPGLNAVINNFFIDLEQAYYIESKNGINTAVTHNGKTYVISAPNLNNAADNKYIKKIYDSLISTLKFE